MTYSRRFFLKSIMLLSLVALVSCSDDDDPVKPLFQFPATMETLWPHSDGNSWTFHLTSEECEIPESAIHENLEDLPPIPPFEDLYARLRNGIPCGHTDISRGSLSLIFDGVGAISPGDTLQRLRSSLEADEGRPKTPQGFSGGLWAMKSDSIVAYPDWKNDDWITWIYLTSDLEPGAEFSFQLTPGGMENLHLQGKIWRHVQCTLPDNTVVNCVERFHLLDLGVHQATDENGEFLGYIRFYIYGVVLYGENIGPIYIREQRIGFSGGDIQDSPGFRFTVDSQAYLTDWAVETK